MFPVKVLVFLLLHLDKLPAYFFGCYTNLSCTCVLRVWFPCRDHADQWIGIKYVCVCVCVCVRACVCACVCVCVCVCVE